MAKNTPWWESVLQSGTMTNETARSLGVPHLSKPTVQPYVDPLYADEPAIGAQQQAYNTGLPRTAPATSYPEPTSSNSKLIDAVSTVAPSTIAPTTGIDSIGGDIPLNRVGGLDAGGSSDYINQPKGSENSLFSMFTGKDGVANIGSLVGGAAGLFQTYTGYKQQQDTAKTNSLYRRLQEDEAKYRTKYRDSWADTKWS